MTPAQAPKSQTPRVNWLLKAVQSVWAEVEPLLIHGVTVAVLLLVSYGLSLLAGLLFPAWHHDIEAVEKFFVFALLYLFGVGTGLLIVVRLCRHLWHEVKGGRH